MSQIFHYQPQSSLLTRTVARQMWASNRFWMETQNLVTKRYGGKRKQHWYSLLWLMKAFERGLVISGQYEKGVRNAKDIQLKELDLYFDDLPAAFDGFSILHISDPHFDGMPGLEQSILSLLGEREFDLCALTGDYRADVRGSHSVAMKALERLIAGLRLKEGAVGILGNHDDCHMVEPMERMGVRVLLNENLKLTRGEQTLLLVGTDDVHYYYTDQALVALDAAREQFAIALVHSPELCDAAVEAGVKLYLCGHTHAGQVCLPTGIPIIRHVRSGRRYFRGHWNHRGMQGVTSSGVGTSGVPVRFNSRGEILALTLRRGRPAQR